MDGMRAIAVLAVIGFHELVSQPFLPLRRYILSGDLGVDVFFAISGFLITTLLLQEADARGAIRFGAFYIRRARRLLPGLAALLVVIAGGALILQSGAHRTATLKNVLIALLYAGNWVPALSHYSLRELNHTWSLASEEQFYLIWPLTLTALLALGVRGRKLLAAVAAVAAAAVVWPQFGVIQGWPTTRFYYGLDTRGAGLALGAVLGVAYVHRLLPQSRAWRVARATLAACSALMALVLLRDSSVLGRVARHLHVASGHLLEEQYALVSLATVLAIWELLESNAHLAHRVLSWRPLVAIGRISYGLYLWDAAIVWGLSPAFTGISGWSLVVIHLLLTLVAATASWFVVERRFRQRRPGPAPPGSPVLGG
jgi:peptidoglycan/LPS O-acetylase OafA/YrhL